MLHCSTQSPFSLDAAVTRAVEVEESQYMCPSSRQAECTVKLGMLESIEEAFEGFRFLCSFKANSYRIFGQPWSSRNDFWQSVCVKGVDDLIKLQWQNSVIVLLNYVPFPTLAFYIVN